RHGTPKHAETKRRPVTVRGRVCYPTGISTSDPMKHLPVHWYEGLFLRPHHLQAADRYWTELVQTTSRWNCAYDYGVYAFEFSKEALANHQLDVQVLKARLRDGTMVYLALG